MTRIKICGITSLEGGLAALQEKADYLGFVFYPPSSRYLTFEAAAQLITELRTTSDQPWRSVGVFVNEPLATVNEAVERCRLDVVQLNGEEGPDYISQIPRPVFKALRIGGVVTDDALGTLASYGAQRLLIDAGVPGRYGGTGLAYDWSGVRSAVVGGFLAGGLTPDNVASALAAAQPWGVDVSSGVERDGFKSPDLIRAFVRAVRQQDLSQAQDRITPSPLAGEG